jgi:DNA repair protein RecN (Recombination protein N)
MLRELHIHNMAVIADARVELCAGLNCFTGQTGAGKSLLLGAVELLLGLRSGTEMLREGAAEGRVAGVFDAPSAEVLAAADLDPSDEQLLVTRKLSATGRTSFSINGSPATASMVKRIGELLVDVHGQHDHQYLLKPGNQLDTLDRFAGCEALRSRFAALHAQIADLRARRGGLAATESLRKQQLELYEFQADEIDKVSPEPGEYEEVSARHKLLSNLSTVQKDSHAAYAAMYEAEGSVVERMQAVMGVLRQLSELDAELSPVAESVKAAAAQVQDAAFELSRYLNRIDLDPAELTEVTDRLNALNRLIHKYGQGAGSDEVIAFRARVEAQMKKLRGESSDFESLDRQIEPLRK